MIAPEVALSSLHLKVLRHHTATGTIDARIVHCADEPERFWVIECGRKIAKPTELDASEKKTKEAWHIPTPQVIELLALRQGLGAGIYSLAEFELPASAGYDEDSLKAGKAPDFLVRRSRANPARWIERRDENKEMIRPIVAYDDFSLFEAGLLNELIAQRAKELGHKTTARIRRLTLLYLQAGRQDWALLPDWPSLGGVGTTKVCRKKTGRPNVSAAQHPTGSEERAAVAGYICQAVDRKKLRSGWKKFKRRRVSAERAWIQTCEEYYAASVQLTGTGKEAKRVVKLKPPNERPTLAEFQRHGPAEEDKAARVNIGVQAFKMQHQGSYNSLKKSPIHLGVKACIDSTSEDQTLVSEASRLKVIGTSYRTVVVVSGLGYVLGLYSGLEPPSTWASLMAVLNCAEDKQAFCKRHGREIQPGEWISFVPRGIFADNGELKSELGVATMMASDISLTFVRSYDPKAKQTVEHNHYKMQKTIDHENEGSTEGRARERGEDDLREEACLTHAEHVPMVIDAILWINNIEQVPHLLTMEMRRDGVKPTRRAILEWMMDNGYATSEPTNIDALRVRCLPKMRAVITRQGVELFDPREGRTNLIPHLLYESTYLHKSGLSDKARKKRIPCEVHVDPSDLRVIWLAGVGSLQALDLCTADPELQRVVLRDWLEICDEEALQLHLDREFRENAYASRVSTQRYVNKQAKEAKHQEAKEKAVAEAEDSLHENHGRESDEESGGDVKVNVPVRPKASMKVVKATKGDIRNNKREEIVRKNNEQLGLVGPRPEKVDDEAQPSGPPVSANAYKAAGTDPGNDPLSGERQDEGPLEEAVETTAGSGAMGIMDLLRAAWKR